DHDHDAEHPGNPEQDTAATVGFGRTHPYECASLPRIEAPTTPMTWHFSSNSHECATKLLLWHQSGAIVMPWT
ncbi:MAG: hypothetical protein L0H03_20215, partial [Rhodococcus sp. (in: high G+C Gram-positive bacteria)]|nr:hypothetical protein [Rhodococcus sp. (in: high G+C Gram-positive bacteria)]